MNQRDEKNEKSKKKKRELQTQVWRGFEIDRLIAKGLYPNVPFLMKRFEVSEATILRDIERLRNRQRGNGFEQTALKPNRLFGHESRADFRRSVVGS